MLFGIQYFKEHLQMTLDGIQFTVYKISYAHHQMYVLFFSWKFLPNTDCQKKKHVPNGMVSHSV